MRPVISLLVLSLTACANAPAVTTPKGGPRGLHADEHSDVAQQHDALAKQTATFPEVRDRGPGAVDYGTAGVPWLRSWDASAEHARMAQIHRSEAAAIQAEFDEACGQRTSEDISMSPLQRYGVSGSNLPNGVTVYLTVAAGPPDRLLADMRCHRAWMLMSTARNMEDCPLDLPGIAVEAKGDAEGITVTIVEKDPKLVAELQRRAAHDLETAHKH